MAEHGTFTDLSLLRAQARILEGLATGAVLTGTLDDLGRQLDLNPDDLRRCLRELVEAGWVVVQTLPFGHLAVRIERRTLGPRRVSRDRRRAMPDAWSP
jgi:DNA-binding IclR family transcriptional regulator